MEQRGGTMGAIWLLRCAMCMGNLIVRDLPGGGWFDPSRRPLAADTIHFAVRP